MTVKLRAWLLAALVGLMPFAAMAADVTYPMPSVYPGIPPTIRGTLKDMGDGTYAPLYYLGGAGTGGALPSSVIAGQTKVSTAGTAVQLPSNALVNGLVICALTTNTGTGTIGGSGVTNTIDGTGNGDVLVAGQCKSFAVNNSNVLYVNGTANNTAFSFSGN